MQDYEWRGNHFYLHERWGESRYVGCVSEALHPGQWTVWFERNDCGTFDSVEVARERMESFACGITPKILVVNV